MNEKEAKVKAYNLIKSFLYIRCCSNIKILETLASQFNLGNDRKYDDNGTNNNKKNIL